jgi:mRNA-degrading endonuclease YafQ of YafQ-DinJ toxin-antitoxin module
MPLSNDQIQTIVKEKRNQKEIKDGVKHQERLRFHVETILHKHDLSPYYREFLRWIGEEEPELLAKDKFERFVQLLKAPIQTIELTESIFSQLFKVFFSQDSYFNYRFNDESLEGDWSDFRDDMFWPTVGFQAMQTAIDSVWIAAVPAEQSTEFPEPQNMLIDIENVRTTVSM